MPTFQTQLLNEVAASHDGPSIPESKRVYFQERFRGRFFDFLVDRFIVEQGNGLTKAKLARRIGKAPEIINRWLGAPSNLTLDSISDLMLGICAEELQMDGSKLLNRAPVNYSHLDDIASAAVEGQRRVNIVEIKTAASSLNVQQTPIEGGALASVGAAS